MLVIVVFLLLIAEFLHPITAFTQDLGRHLLMGKIILQTHTVPQINLLSYTYPNFPFINTHWLSEVIFFIVQNMFGFTGLLALTTTLVVIAFFLIFSTASKKNSIAAGFVSILYLNVLFERTDIRPEIFSFLFLSLFIVILYKYREKFTRWIFLLPFIELLWVNIHIYFPIGIVVISLFTIDWFIIYRKNIFSQNTYILLAILVTSTIVTIFNPNGLEGALYPMHVFQNYGYQIEENQTVFFLWNYFGGKTTILYFFISAVLLFSVLLLTIKKARPIDLLLAVFFTYLAATAERNMPLFVFGTFIPFIYALSSFRFSVSVTLKRAFSIILFLIVILNIQDVVRIKSFGFNLTPGAERGADFFIANNIQGPLFNNFDIGSYLDYRFYPKEKVFIDGRPEAYPAAFIQNVYIPMQLDKAKFDEISNKYNFNAIFFSHTDMTPWAQTFLKWIVQDKNWRIIYLDDYVIILVKNTPKNARIAQKLDTDQTSKTSLLRLANFFHIVGWQENEEKIYQQLLIINAGNCAALYNLVTILSQHNNPTATIYYQRFQQSCR